ncbi:hypothetical protein [Ralstonia holmesii]|uniref:hypothetical protein n=1 Tax=Ralstonia holmesii TaxID=3058602 RepID=UPI003D65AD89
MSKWIPSPHEIVREGIIVLGGVLIAAWVLSRMPSVKAWVQQQGTLTVKDPSGNVLY